MADFDPRQLDALEDALEDLEIDGDLAGLDLAPELLERLVEYQQVLALTRDAFPLDDPPEGLLDGVLAEAREAARTAPVITPVIRGGWRRAWERWRSSLVPAAALAGAAALVLWIAKPGDDRNLAVVDPPKTQGPEAKEDAPGEPASGQSLERDSAEAARSATQPEEPPPEPDDEIELLDEEPPTPAEPKPIAKKKATASGAGGAAAPPMPAVDPTPVTPLSKDDAWSDLERADVLRRKGDCDRARSIYDKVIAGASQANAIAQAKAGIGLCFEQDGKSSKADEWFEQARASNPGIDAWIRGQRDDQPLPGEKKKTKANDAYENLDSL